jgi:cell wall-associated NlpC family hydrolase
VSDRRLTPANDRVAAAHLADAAPGLARVTGIPMQVTRPVADLCRAPGGARDRQLLWGETVDIYETRAGHSFLQARKDGHVGYLDSAALIPAQAATHWVEAPACHVYEAASIKSPDRLSLSFGSRIGALAEHETFVETAEGFIPRQHLREIGETMDDPVDVATLFLGTPYLWGGNSRWGIDCSGLVQWALIACGQPCPGDSDLQKASLGHDVSDPADLRRGDLLFWPSHVAMVVDRTTLIHSNGGYMITMYEPIRTTIARIEAQGEAPVTAHKRL